VRKLLFVEGAGDKDFFTKLFEKVLNVSKYEFNIQILVPTDVDADKDGKESAKAKLVEHINREYKNKDVFLACILDADYFDKTGDPKNVLNGLLEKIPSEAGYEIVQHETSGYYFESKNKYNNIGIWFMPNNHDEGMFEDWLLKIAKSDEADLIGYADTVCKQAPRIEFKQEYAAKAQVAVWTALQQTPHLGTENIILQNLYNSDSDAFKNFITWLKFVFEPQKNDCP
jgi:hypothetical protein